MDLHWPISFSFICARYPYCSHSEGMIPTEAWISMAHFSFVYLRVLSLYSHSEGGILAEARNGFLAHLPYVYLCALASIRDSEGRILTEAWVGSILAHFSFVYPCVLSIL